MTFKRKLYPFTKREECYFDWPFFLLQTFETPILLTIQAVLSKSRDVTASRNGESQVNRMTFRIHNFVK